MELLERVQSSLGENIQLERELSGGGMSRVFLGTERSLGRRIVIKVPRDDLQEGVSIERFKREIATIARLQHPHIVPLLSAGEAGGMLYYAMPLIEGESLRQRLTREGELPIADALRTLREIVLALSYAHRHGIVHRDIKPENILFSDGSAVVTDFGIAKALLASLDDGDAPPTTLTSAGIAMGTPAYMAPEQVAADPSLDHRADLYSIGCVAYEMLTGRPPFDERLPQQIMAAHASMTPVAIEARRGHVPRELAAMVMQCLEKRPADRPQLAEDLVRALDGVLATPTGTVMYARELPGSANRPRMKRRVVIAAGITAIVVAAAAAAAGALLRTNEVPSRRARYLSIILPDSAPMAFIGSATLGIGQRALAISPDGSMVAYIADVNGTTMLYLRPMDGDRVLPVAGSEGAYSPIFSPDSRWIAYLAGTKLYKVAVAGGRPIPLAEVSEPYCATWLTDGRIVLSAVGGNRFDVVHEAGGTPIPLAGLATIALSPTAIGSRWLLAHMGRDVTFISPSDTVRHWVLLSDGTTMLATEAPTASRMIGSSPALVAGKYLVFVRAEENGVLMALPFDTTRMRAAGDPRPILEGIRVEGGAYGAAQYSISDDGTLVYASGTNELMMRMVLRGRDGGIDTLPFGRVDLTDVNLSRDGRTLVGALWRPGVHSRHAVLDLERGTTSMLPDSLGRVIMDYDGRSVLASKRIAPGQNITVRLSLTGVIRDTVLKDGIVTSMSADGNVFAVRGRAGSAGSWTVWRDSTVHAPVPHPAGLGLSSVSPSGNWVATTVRPGSQSQVVVVRSTDPNERYQISISGGEEPLWSPSENEIVYRWLNLWYAVSIDTRDGFVAGRPRLLFDGPFYNLPEYSHGLMPDGRHLLFMGSPVRTTTRINVITDWLSDLQRLVPAK